MLPRDLVLRVLRDENRAAGLRGGLDDDLAAALQRIRDEGLSRARDLLPGISAIAVPVHDGSARLVLALTAIGPTPAFDSGPRSALSLAMKAAAEGLSVRLGLLRPTEFAT
jgi:DNA-binding IclR family transcriptional regulator